MQNINEYFKLHEKAFNNDYIRTISNIRMKINPIYLNNIKQINELIKEQIENTTIFNDFVNILDYKDFNKILNNLFEIKFCNITEYNSKTISLINTNNISLNKKLKHQNKLCVSIQECGKNSELIKYYLENFDNSYYKNNKRKNDKVKQSLCAWKQKYIYNKNMSYSYPNNSEYIQENININETLICRSIINNIIINNDQVITSGRTLLPGTILFTFKNNSRISIKDDWIQLIPSKQKGVKESIDDLILMINDLIYFIKTLLKIESNILGDKIDDMIDNINFNCDFIYKINKDIIIPHINCINNIKNLNKCITIRSIKNIDEYNTIDDYIKNNIKSYTTFTDKIKKYDIIELLLLEKEDLIEIFNEIFK